MLLAAVNALVLSLIIFGGRNVLGYIFSNEKEVVDYVTVMAPLLCLSIIADSIQGVLSGKWTPFQLHKIILISLLYIYIKNLLNLSLSLSSSGVARGCGWQHIGAYINLAAFYLFGIPIAVALSFWLNMRGKGLWIGVLCGATLQTLMLFVITTITNWEKQVFFVNYHTISVVEMQVFFS